MTVTDAPPGKRTGTAVMITASRGTRIPRNG